MCINIHCSCLVKFNKNVGFNLILLYMYILTSECERVIVLRRISDHGYIKPKSDIHCNRSATSPRPKFKTIAEVAEESQLGFAVGRRLVGDWSPTNRGLVAD